MKLLSLELSNFRRFAERSSVRLTEPVIAIVGPNEAGKSSLLRALELMEDERPFETRDGTRRIGCNPEIIAHYELSDGDREALGSAGVAAAKDVKRCRLIKQPDGKFLIELVGRTRNLEKRTAVADCVEEAAGSSSVVAYGNNAEDRKLRQDRYRRTVTHLRSNAEALADAQIQEIRSNVAEIASLLNQPRTGPEEKKLATKLTSIVDDLMSEEQCWQASKAHATVRARKPKVIFFNEPARDLKATYDIAKSAAAPPDALGNLARMAGLPLDRLKTAVESGNVPYKEELLESANETLRAVFARAWVDSTVVPHLRAEGGTLHVLIRARDHGLSRFEERSDGLRWFVALIGFLTANHHHDSRPILLVDEAETHLSYDAQASLVETLEHQQVAQKVIYTTHSAGCLPSDLGTAIRAVAPLQGERSTIHNGFWARGLGLSPVFVAMGLAPFAFTTARNELIGEGPGECILLPSLIRQATSITRLTFQVAPGASSVDSLHLNDLVTETDRALFVLDGDAGGRRIRDKLIQAGVPQSAIASYSDFGGDGLQLEDFVALDAYCTAVNEEIERWQRPSAKITPADILQPCRAKSVDSWCEAHHLKGPSKVAVAQLLAESAAAGRPILDPDRAPILKRLHGWAMGQFRARRRRDSGLSVGESTAT